MVKCVPFGSGGFPLQKYPLFFPFSFQRQEQSAETPNGSQLCQLFSTLQTLNVIHLAFCLYRQTTVAWTYEQRKHCHYSVNHSLCCFRVCHNVKTPSVEVFFKVEAWLSCPESFASNLTCTAVSSWLPYSTVCWVGGGNPSLGCTKMFEHLFQAGMNVLNQFFLQNIHVIWINKS